MFPNRVTSGSISMLDRYDGHKIYIYTLVTWRVDQPLIGAPKTWIVLKRTKPNEINSKKKIPTPLSSEGRNTRRLFTLLESSLTTTPFMNSKSLLL